MNYVQTIVHILHTSHINSNQYVICISGCWRAALKDDADDDCSAFAMQMQLQWPQHQSSLVLPNPTLQPKLMEPKVSSI